MKDSRLPRRRSLFAFALAMVVVALGRQALAAPPVEPVSNAGGDSFNCAGRTPLSCASAPIEKLDTGACAYLRRCLTGNNVGDQTIEAVTVCRAPVFSGASNLGRAAAVDAYVDIVNGPPSHATFLFVRGTEGWCLADRLLDPEWTHGGSCATQHTLRWSSASAGSVVILSAVSQRICHMPLDKSELQSGQSDVAMTQCRRARYRVDSGTLTLVSSQSTDGGCSSKASRQR